MDPVEIVGGLVEYGKLKRLSKANGFELVIKNQWQHWCFYASNKGDERLLEWWPSTGRVVMNKEFAGALRRFNVDGIIELLATMEQPSKKTQNLNSFSWSVWTDGSTDPNPGKGGAAFVAQHKNGHKFELAVGYQKTTISRMELQSVAFALMQLVEADPSPSVLVFTDSLYAMNIWSKNWIKTWRRNGWQTKEGQPVENRDLIAVIDEYIARCFVVRFQKVKSHKNNGSMNDYVDELARNVRRSGPWLVDHGYMARQRMWQDDGVDPDFYDRLGNQD